MGDDWRKAGRLPWGWWLCANGNAFEDEHGRTWKSVRDAFFQGELGLPAVHFASEQHELMLRVMAAADRRWVDVHESNHDVFKGDMMFWRFHQCWLHSIGMLDRSIGSSGDASPLSARLSPEGRSVLMMLQATREPAWEALPMAEVIEAVAASDRGPADDDREGVLGVFERAVGMRRHVFARERVGPSHLITLTSMEAGGAARMPVRRVAWSLGFADEAVRDDLFAWVAARVDRWDDWGGMAVYKGADAFTAHLLVLMVATGAHGPRS